MLIMPHIFIFFNSRYNIMKKRIAGQLLRMHQSRVLGKEPTQLTQLQELAYSLIADMITDIKRPFMKVCIHGRSPHFILPFLHKHNSHYGVAEKDTTITLVDYLRNPQLQALWEAGMVKEVRYVDNADGWLPEEDQFDLLMTSLSLHHANFEEDLLTKYLRTLKPDGALVGSSFAEGTLSELYWSYLLAQNERHGGMSPKVLQMPSLGELGNSLTMAKYTLATVVSHDETLEFDSVVDLMTLLQQMGQSGYLRGRRKGVYKDLMLAAAALYSTEFDIEGRIRATLALSKFIGWKHHANQPKSLSRGPHVGSVEFSDELRKFGDEVETYVIEEGVDEPKKIK